jgi:hypothetical protein
MRSGMRERPLAIDDFHMLFVSVCVMQVNRDRSCGSLGGHRCLADAQRMK